MPSTIWIAVAGQADQPLDVVGAVGRMLEDHHVAALRLAREDAAVERAHRERAGMPRVAVGHLVDEQEVADQERRLHRARRDPERLEEQRADHAGEQQRVDDGLDELEKPALGLALGSPFRPSVPCPRAPALSRLPPPCQGALPGRTGGPTASSRCSRGQASDAMFPAAHPASRGGAAHVRAPPRSPRRPSPRGGRRSASHGPRRGAPAGVIAAQPLGGPAGQPHGRLAGPRG